MRAPLERARWPRGGLLAYLAPRSAARLHAGVDLACPDGSVVVAPESGEVVVDRAARTPRDVLEARAASVAVPRGEWSGYGPRVAVIRGDSGVWHLLGHLAALPAGVVSPLTRILEGDVIGRTSLGHLHWEVRTALRPRAGQSTVDVTVDPAVWLGRSSSPAREVPAVPAARPTRAASDLSAGCCSSREA